MYDIYQQRVAECDQELQKHLTRLPFLLSLASLAAPRVADGP